MRERLPEDPIITRVAAELMEKYRCHTIILYGSKARGNDNENSDYDLIGINSSGIKLRDTRLIDEKWLDAWIFDEQHFARIDASFLHLRHGIVLIEKDLFGTELLASVEKIYQQGPEKLAEDDRQVKIVWCH